MESSEKKPAAPLLISAVLPAFNEAPNLEATVRDLTRALQQTARDYEIIIVDDGSADATPALADRLAQLDPRVRVVHHPANRGYGAALRSGFDAARLDWIFFTDSDGQFVPDQIKLLTALADRHDFIAGYRERRADPTLRRLYGFVFSAAVRLLFRVTARDVNCAFKLFRRALIADAGLTSEGALINAELLHAARLRGVDPAEVPVSHLPRHQGRQTGGSPRVMARAAAEIVRLWLRARRRTAPAIAAPASEAPDRPDEDG